MSETVSGGELNGSGFDNCLLQVGPPGHYTCAYLNDQQVRNLIAALQAFLKTTVVLIFALLCAVGAFGQSQIETPVPKEPAHKHFHLRFDTGWWARAEWTASALDYSTTGLANNQCLSGKAYPKAFLEQWCGERDPLMRPFIGYHHNPIWKLSATWAVESTLVSIIPNKKVRRATQIGLIIGHAFCGIDNLKNWH